MPRLPSSSDVPSLRQPRVQPIQTPKVPSPLEIGIQEAIPAVQRLEEAQLKQQIRQETVDRSSMVNQLDIELNEKLEEFKAKRDLSKEQDRQEFGEYSIRRMNELIAEHNGSEDSKAKLRIRLGDITSSKLGMAAGIGTKIGMENVERALDLRVSPLMERAAFVRPEDFKSLIEDLDEVMSDFNDVVDPSKETEKRTQLIENMAMSRIDRYLINGNPDLAETFFYEKGGSEYITPNMQRETIRRIETAMSSKKQEENRAESPIGKIRADEKAGLISKEDAEAAIKKETHIAAEKLREGGGIVAATDLNPELPDEYSDIYLIKQPNGNLTVMKGKDGTDKVTYFQQELEDGTIGVFMQEGNKPPQYVSKLTVEGGKEARTGVSARAEAVQGRADVNSKLRERGLDLTESRLEQTIKQNARTSEDDLRDDFDKRAKPFREQKKALDMLEVALQGDISGLDNKIITNLVSRAIAPTNVRAQAELDSFKNFGDLGERISGSIKTFFSGKRTDAQLDQIRTLVKEMRDMHVGPAIEELERAYEGVAIRSNLDPNNVVVRSVIKVTTQEEVDKLQSGDKFIWTDGQEYTKQ